MRDRYFVDTVCWIGLLNKDDAIHEQADLEYKSLITIKNNIAGSGSGA